MIDPIDPEQAQRRITCGPSGVECCDRQIRLIIAHDDPERPDRLHPQSRHFVKRDGLRG